MVSAPDPTNQDFRKDDTHRGLLAVRGTLDLAGAARLPSVLGPLSHGPRLGERLPGGHGRLPVRAGGEARRLATVQAVQDSGRTEEYTRERSLLDGSVPKNWVDNEDSSSDIVVSVWVTVISVTAIDRARCSVW